MTTFKALLTLRTSCGCVGQQFLGADLTWDADPVNETVQAILGRIDMTAMEVVEVLELDGDDWRLFEETVTQAELLDHIHKGFSLASAFDGGPHSLCDIKAD